MTPALTNTVSTVAGIPVTWVILLGFQLAMGATGSPDISSPWLERLHSVTIQSAWLLPYEDERMAWMVPAATAFFMIPYFLVSFAVEAVFAKFVIDLPMRRLYRVSAIANAITYGIILGLMVLWFLLVIIF